MSAADYTGDILGGAGGRGDVAALWREASRSLDDLGFDKLNYTVFRSPDAVTGINPTLSTMSQSWLRDYADRRLDLMDPLIGYMASGARDPIVFDTNLDGDIGEVARTAREGGMTAGVFIPLSPALGGPPAGMVLGSSQRSPEIHRLIQMHGARLMSLSHIFHAAAGPQALMKNYGAVALTGRERDCLQAMALGKRVSAAAYDLSIAEVTVGLHLKNARRKLGARSLPEAVARAVLFGQIEPI